MPVTIFDANGDPIDIGSVTRGGDQIQQNLLWTEGVELVNTTVNWTTSQAANTEKTVTIPGPDDGAVPGRLALFVRNPSTVTALTVLLRWTWVDSGSTTRQADLSTAGGQSAITVLEADSTPIASAGGQVFIVDGGLLPEGGQLSLKNNATADSGGLTVSVRVVALGGS